MHVRVDSPDSAAQRIAAARLARFWHDLAMVTPELPDGPAR